MEESVVEIAFGKGLVQEVRMGVWELTERIACYNLEMKRVRSY